MELAFLVGRILFGLYFVMAGYNHIVKSGHLVGYASSKGVPAPKVAIIGSGIIVFLGGLSVLLGYMPYVGLTLVLVFLVPVTLMMHAFWKSTTPEDRMQNQLAFNKNLALIGATLMLYAISVPWLFSIGQ